MSSVPGIGPKDALLHSFSTGGELKKALAEYIIEAQESVLNASDDSPKRKDHFTIALSGGSLPKMLEDLVEDPRVKWDRWHIYYADERFVPAASPDSNHYACTEALYSKVAALPKYTSPSPPPKFQIHQVIEDDQDPSDLQLHDVAGNYLKKLKDEFSPGGKDAMYPVFDLILLGIGPDGHTCSLFPGHELLTAPHKNEWVSHLSDSPKPPPERVTFTYHVLNHAKRVAFVATGAGKVDVLPTILDRPGEGLPASRVKPANGQVSWFVDDPASEKVQYAKTPYPPPGKSQEKL